MSLLVGHSVLVNQSVDRYGSWSVFAYLVTGSDPLVDSVRKSFPSNEMPRTFCHVKVSIFQKDSTAADHHWCRTSELLTFQDVHLHCLTRQHGQPEDQSVFGDRMTNDCGCWELVQLPGCESSQRQFASLLGSRSRYQHLIPQQCVLYRNKHWHYCWKCYSNSWLMSNDPWWHVRAVMSFLPYLYVGTCWRVWQRLYLLQQQIRSHPFFLYTAESQRTSWNKQNGVK